MRNRNGGRPDSRPLRILFCSDAIWHPTGYGITTDYLCRRMAAEGHRVYNFAPGAMHQGMAEMEPNLTVLSSQFGDDRWGNQTLSYHLNWINPDLVVTWLDAQGLIAYGWTEHPVYMWAPIDTWPIPQQEEAIYGRAAKIMVPSEWGVKVLADQGIKSEYLPCGIDLSIYDISAEGRARWRKQLRPAIEDDTFLIGSVGLNTGHPDRKGYGFEFDAIKRFAKDKKVRVYIHTNAQGDGGAIDLNVLRTELGLQDVVCFSRPFGPLAETPLFMRDMYNAFDILLHCGIAEGFGIPVIEAQACGTGVVANACTSMTELLGYGSYASEPWGDMIVATSSRVALPSIDNIVERLEVAYWDWQQRRTGKATSEESHRLKVRANVMRFNQDKIYEDYWRPLLAEVPPPLDFKAGARKLMLAAGGQNYEGYVHHDREKLWPHIEVAHDLNEFPWPWEDDSWDYIEASDILEHLRANIVQFMDEAWRIIAPGGYIFIHTAEAGSWQLNMDPTHTQGFLLSSFDYFDPETRHGEIYSYTDKKWKIVRRTEDPAGLHFVLTPRKEPVQPKERPKLEVLVGRS